MKVAPASDCLIAKSRRKASSLAAIALATEGIEPLIFSAIIIMVFTSPIILSIGIIITPDRSKSL
jgi:hypothetical protein